MHRRATDSDYDSGTEYAASSRVQVRPSSYLRHSRRRQRGNMGRGRREGLGRTAVSPPEHIRAAHRRMEAASTPRALVPNKGGGGAVTERAGCSFPFAGWEGISSARP